MKKNTVGKRPYWHVDAKWISGIIFSIILCTTIFTFGLMKITEENVAVDISAYTIATSFSSKGLSDTTEIDDLKDAVKASKKGYIKPIEGLDVIVRLEDLEDKTPVEIRLDIFRQIAQPLYEGSEGLAKITETDEMYQDIESNQGLLAFFTRDTNLYLKTQFMLLSFASIIFLALTIFFSYGFGRLVSPSVVALFVGLPNTIFWGIVNLVSKNINEVSLPFISDIPGNEKLTTSITEIIANALPAVAGIFYKTYGYLFIISIVILCGAGVGKIIVKMKNKDEK